MMLGKAHRARVVGDALETERLRIADEHAENPTAPWQFADRPVRAAGHALTVHLVEEWAPGNQDSASFTKDPPNATLSVLNKAKSTVADIVVVLKAPKLDGDRLVFDVVPIEGDLGQADGPATLFIDIVNLPIARRTGHRAAWYAGAKQP